MPDLWYRCDVLQVLGRLTTGVHARRHLKECFFCRVHQPRLCVSG